MKVKAESLDKNSYTKRVKNFAKGYYNPKKLHSNDRYHGYTQKLKARKSARRTFCHVYQNRWKNLIQYKEQ